MHVPESRATTPESSCCHAVVAWCYSVFWRILARLCIADDVPAAFCCPCCWREGEVVQNAGLEAIDSSRCRKAVLSPTRPDFGIFLRVKLEHRVLGSAM